MFALSSLLGDYAKEIGQQIKANAEVSGRANPNLLDAMLAAEEYGMTKETQFKHLRQVPTSEERGLWRRGTLYDVSHKASEEIKRRLVKNEVEQIDRLKQNELSEFQDKLNTVLVEKGDEKSTKQIRDATFGCIPEAFHSCLPIPQSITSMD